MRHVVFKGIWGVLVQLGMGQMWTTVDLASQKCKLTRTVQILALLDGLLHALYPSGGVVQGVKYTNERKGTNY